MLERIVFWVLSVIIAFLCGWYAAWHPAQFFGWAGSVGTFWQQKIDHQQTCPTDYVLTQDSLSFTCTHVAPTPTPSPTK